MFCEFLNFRLYQNAIEQLFCMLNTSLSAAANVICLLNVLNNIVGYGLTSRVLISNRTCGLAR
jgi:hypothetical protein